MQRDNTFVTTAYGIGMRPQFLSPYPPNYGKNGIFCKLASRESAIETCLWSVLCTYVTQALRWITFNMYTTMYRQAGNVWDHKIAKKWRKCTWILWKTAWRWNTTFNQTQQWTVDNNYIAYRKDKTKLNVLVIVPKETLH